MPTRRSLLVYTAFVLLGVTPALSFEIEPYTQAKAAAAIASGKPVIIHVYAPWCLQCHIQKSILDGVKDDKAYSGLKVFRVDYDNQKDVVTKLDCPRSTVIAYKGGKELKRMSWGVTQDSVVEVLKAAL